jgi:sigma-B regulation protein RsbU (phosphoserine phosphatase)
MGAESPSILIEDIRSAMCVPLWNENRVIGLIYADSQGGAPRFNEGDLEVLTLVGHLAAITIENERLYEKDRRAEAELAAAAEIQKRLLPAAPPALAGYEMSGANRPSQGVGGDYYDFVARAEGRMAVAIGDVCGHGLASALLMATAQAAFRVLTAGASPVPVLLGRLNDIICDNAGEGIFVTFFCGDLEAASGRFSYGSAGHNPPLLRRATGAVERLAAREIVLGVRRASAYTAHDIVLERGDLLILYTDGITETRSPGGEEFGEERLLAATEGHRESPLDAIRDHIFEEAAAFRQAAMPEDDLTLALIRRR